MAVFGRCANPGGHGHNYVLEVTVGGELDPETGMIADLKWVKDVVDHCVIDHVDHEYCLRLNAKGFSVVQVNDVEIIHRPGTLTSVIGGRIKFASHSPQRLYYFCRNGFYVCNKYKKLFPAFTKHFASVLTKEIAKVPFQESKWIRLEMIAFGYLDYKKNKLGKLELRS